MKRISWLLLILSVALTVAGLRYALSNQSQRKREASYEAARTSYSQVLKPGMTRKETEKYLRDMNKSFQQMCCVNAKASKHSWDDLVKIGKEDAPWFCSQNNVYVAFQFVDHVQTSKSVGWQGDDLDTLNSITVYRRLEGCL
jgi:hypothetical protein